MLEWRMWQNVRASIAYTVDSEKYLCVWDREIPNGIYRVNEMNKWTEANVVRQHAVERKKKRTQFLHHFYHMHLHYAIF